MADQFRQFSFKEISYLCFEGGGGKGVAYLGVIQALEQLHYDEFISLRPEKDDLKSKYPTGIPVFPLHQPVQQRKFKGVSGTSAGAITAFALSLGMNAHEIQELFDDLQNHFAHRLFSKTTQTKANPFDRFLTDPDFGNYRAVIDGNVTQKKDVHRDPLRIAHILSSIAGRFFPVFSRTSIQKNYLFQRLAVGYGPTSDQRGTKDYILSLLSNRGLFSGIGVRELYRKLLKKHLIDKLADYGIDLNTLGQPSSEDSPDLNLQTTVANIKQKIAADKIEQINFQEYYYLTGVDLVVSSTNVSRERTFYFSAYHTPLFPVIEAVGMSGCFPFVFKPVWVDSTGIGEHIIANGIVDARMAADDYGVYVGTYYKGGAAYNESMRGFYCDGGMLQNFPLHAFDHNRKLREAEREGLYLYYWKTPEDRFLEVSGHVPYGNFDFKPHVWGFNLFSKPPVEKWDEKYIDKEIFLKEKGAIAPILDFFNSFLNTYLYPGGDGQIRSADEMKNVTPILVYLPQDAGDYRKKEKAKKDLPKKERKRNTDAFSWDVIDFATPVAELERAKHTTLGEEYRKKLATHKLNIISIARSSTIEFAIGKLVPVLLILFSHFSFAQQAVPITSLEQKILLHDLLLFRHPNDERNYLIMEDSMRRDYRKRTGEQWGMAVKDVDEAFFLKYGTRKYIDTFRIGGRSEFKNGDEYDTIHEHHPADKKKKKNAHWYGWSRAPDHSWYRDHNHELLYQYSDGWTSGLDKIERTKLIEDTTKITKSSTIYHQRARQYMQRIEEAEPFGPEIWSYIYYKDDRPFTGSFYKKNALGQLSFEGEVKKGFLWGKCTFYNAILWNEQTTELPRKLVSPVYTLFNRRRGDEEMLDAKRHQMFDDSYSCGMVAYERERTIDDYDRLGDRFTMDSAVALGRTTLLVQKFYDEAGKPVRSTFARISKDSIQLQEHLMPYGKTAIYYRVRQTFPFEYYYEIGDSIKVQNYDYADGGKDRSGFGSAQYKEMRAKKLLVLSPDAQKILKLVVRTGRSEADYAVYYPEKGDKTGTRYIHTDGLGNKNLYTLAKRLGPQGRVVLNIRDAKELLDYQFRLVPDIRQE